MRTGSVFHGVKGFYVNFNIKQRLICFLFFFVYTAGIPLLGLILSGNIKFDKLTFNNLYLIANSFLSWNVADIIILDIATIINTSMILRHEKIRMVIAFVIISVSLCFDSLPFFYYIYFGKIKFALQSLLFSVWMPVYVYLLNRDADSFYEWDCVDLQHFKKVVRDYQISGNFENFDSIYSNFLKDQKKFNIFLFCLIGIYFFIIFLFIENIIYNSSTFNGEVFTSFSCLKTLGSTAFWRMIPLIYYISSFLWFFFFHLFIGLN